MKHRLFTLFALGAFALMGCEDDDVIFKDEGTLCLSGERTPEHFHNHSLGDGGVPNTILGNEPVRVGVYFGCGSSSCNTLLEARCSAVVDGDTIKIDSFAKLASDNGGLFGGCSSDCQFWEATCDLPPLEPGTYTIVHGETSQPLAIPEEHFPCPGFEPRF